MAKLKKILITAFILLISIVTSIGGTYLALTFENNRTKTAEKAYVVSHLYNIYVGCDYSNPVSVKDISKYTDFNIFIDDLKNEVEVINTWHSNCSSVLETAKNMMSINNQENQNVNGMIFSLNNDFDAFTPYIQNLIKTDTYINEIWPLESPFLKLADQVKGMDYEDTLTTYMSAYSKFLDGAKAITPPDVMQKFNDGLITDVEILDNYYTQCLSLSRDITVFNANPVSYSKYVELNNRTAELKNPPVLSFNLDDMFNYTYDLLGLDTIDTQGQKLDSDMKDVVTYLQQQKGGVTTVNEGVPTYTLPKAKNNSIVAPGLSTQSI